MTSRRTRLTAAAVFVAGLACAVFIMEAGLKAITATPLWRALPVIEPILGRPDAGTGYVFTPDIGGVWVRENRAPLRITDLGLRGPAGITQAKPAGVSRIALLGDSVTEALQVDVAATFGALLQDRLNEGGKAKVEVINLAMSGNGPLRQLVRLEQRGYGFDPDVVLSVTSPFDFLTGELRDDSVNPGYVPDGRGGWTRGYAFRNRFSLRQADSLPGQIFLSAIQRSEVARLIYLRSRDPLPKLLGVESAARPAAAAAAPDLCATADLERLYRLWQQHQPAQDWQVLEKYFDELAASAAGRPVRLLYAMRDLPVPSSVCGAQRTQRTALVALISAALSARGITFIDLESRIVANTGVAGSADLKGLHGFGLQLGQGHLNEDGHRRYAEVLQAVLAPLLRP